MCASKAEFLGSNLGVKLIRRKRYSLSKQHDILHTCFASTKCVFVIQILSPQHISPSKICVCVRACTCPTLFAFSLVMYASEMSDCLT